MFDAQVLGWVLYPVGVQVEANRGSTGTKVLDDRVGVVIRSVNGG